MSKFHGVSPDVVAMGQEIIDKCNKGIIAPNTANEDFFDFLVEHHLAFVEDGVSVDRIMVHMSNRGSLGLNAHNVHKNLRDIDTSGCDPKQLNSAAVYQASPTEPLRSKQITFNETLIANAKKLLAPLNGSEDLCSVGTGHFVAGMRAIKAKCRTTHASLGGEKGILMPDRFRSKDKRLARVFDFGLDNVRVYKWQVEAAWPQSPDLVQRALNSSHKVSSESTEPQVMASIAELDKNRLEDTLFEEVLEAVRLSNPPCAKYVDIVGKLAVEIGGGPEVPLVKFMVRFAEIFGENKALGEEFLKSLLGLKISDMDPIPYIKVSLMLCNLACDVADVKDGFSRLLVADDCDKLNRASKRDQLIQLNDEMSKAWNILEQLLNEGRISVDSFDLLMGKYMVRQALLSVGKEKYGPDKRTYGESHVIRDCLIKSICMETGSYDVHLGPFEAFKNKIKENENERGCAEPQAKKAKIADGLKTVDDLSNVGPLLLAKGFKIGTYIQENGGVGDGVYYISDLMSKSVIIKKFAVFEKDDRIWQVTARNLLTHWGVHKGCLPRVCPITPEPGFEFPEFHHDVTRIKAYDCLLRNATKAGNPKLTYMFSPCGVLANNSLKVGALKLFPLTQLSKIQLQKSNKESGGMTMKVGAVSLTMFPTSRPSDKTPDDELHKYAFVPCWWVETNSAHEKVNMEWKSVHDGDVLMPVLQNTKAVKVGDRLYYFKAKAEKEKPMVRANEIDTEMLKTMHGDTDADGKGSGDEDAEGEEEKKDDHEVHTEKGKGKKSKGKTDKGKGKGKKGKSRK